MEREEIEEKEEESSLAAGVTVHCAQRGMLGVAQPVRNTVCEVTGNSLRGSCLLSIG